MTKYNTTEEALKAYKAHLRLTTLNEIASWTTLTAEKVWSDIKDLARKGRLVYTVLDESDMAMRIEYFDR